MSVVAKPRHDDHARISHRQVRNEQTTTFERSWKGPLAELASAGVVRQLGGDGLKVWQIERLLERTQEPRLDFNLLSVSPCHSQVWRCQAPRRG